MKVLDIVEFYRFDRETQKEVWLSVEDGLHRRQVQVVRSKVRFDNIPEARLPGILVLTDAGLAPVDQHAPYFYAAYTPSHDQIISTYAKLVEKLRESLGQSAVAGVGRLGVRGSGAANRLGEVDEDPVRRYLLVESLKLGNMFTNYYPILDVAPADNISECFFYRGGFWEKDKCTAYRIVVPKPAEVRLRRDWAKEKMQVVLEALKRVKRLCCRLGLKLCNHEPAVTVAAHNIRYPVRVAFDIDAQFFGYKPLYYTDDVPSPDAIGEVLVLDIEVLDNDRILVGLLPHRIGEDPDPSNADHLWLPDEVDRLKEYFERFRVVVGFNTKNFDLPYIMKYVEKPLIYNQLHIDLVEVIATHAQSFQIGSARSLYAVAKVMADSVGITKEELDLKRRVSGRVRGLPENELIRYNTNDLVLTAKISNAIVPFVTTISAVTQIPPTIVASLPAGLIAEYFLFRYYEVQGVLLGYRSEEPFLVGERVLTEENIDVGQTKLLTLFGRQVAGVVKVFDRILGVDERKKLRELVEAIESVLRRLVVGRSRGASGGLEAGAGGKQFRVYRNVLQVDFKAEYPSFVLGNHIDPLALKRECRSLPLDLYKQIPSFKGLLDALDCFDVNVEGPLWKVVSKLYTVRANTKKLKKEDPKYEYVDNAIKAVLNATAYGVTVIQKSDAPLADKRVGEMIFHGTRAIQYALFSLINADEWFASRGIKAIYSDTDSFFLAAPRWDEKLVKEAIDRLNSFARLFGLELDVEDVWDIMIVYKKKNYILAKADGTVKTKGSALHMDERLLLPSGVHGLDELVKVDVGELDAWIDRFVREAQDEDLLLIMSSQVSRFVLHDYQTVKRRAREEQAKYLLVRTPWDNIESGYLLRLGPGQLKHPQRLPLVSLLVSSGSGYLDLTQFRGYEVKEGVGLTRFGKLRFLFEARFGHQWDYLIFTGSDYYLARLNKLYYVLEADDRKIEIPSDYTEDMAAKYKWYRIVGVKATNLKVVKLDYQDARAKVEELAKHMIREFYMTYVLPLRRVLARH